MRARTILITTLRGACTLLQHRSIFASAQVQTSPLSVLNGMTQRFTALTGWGASRDFLVPTAKAYERVSWPMAHPSAH